MFLAWWTRTFPIMITRTKPPRTTQLITPSTALRRISNPVSIAVPVALFAVVLLTGFGLIGIAVLTGGRGVFFLTRADESSVP